MVTNREEMTPEEKTAADEARRISEDEANRHLDQRRQEEETREQAFKTLEAVLIELKILKLELAESKRAKARWIAGGSKWPY
jgi:hypothetical protein